MRPDTPPDFGGEMATNRLPIPAEESRIERRPRDYRDVSHVDVKALESDLRDRVEGEVRFDAGAKSMYAVDASNYRQVPIGVVIPKSEQDVIATVATCREHEAPVLSRGGGTSLAGQCCNVAVVIDFSKYMHHILELNPEHKYAWVEPGTICDDVVSAARPYKLTYGPDPATHNHCCFGGMLGNNSCGVHAQFAGKAVDNTEEMKVLLYDGTTMDVGWTHEAELRAKIRIGGREAEIYRGLLDLRNRYGDLIRQKYPNILRRVSGYNLDQLLPNENGQFNLARALVGSEGTLVTILKSKMRLIYNHPERVLVVLGYPSVYEAGDHIPQIREYTPIGLEGLDERLIENVVKKGGLHRDYLHLLPEGKGWLMVEFGFDTQQEAIDQAHRMMDELKKLPDAPHMKLIVDENEQDHMWKIRESGLGATAFVPGEPDAWPGWEDSAVPVDKVGNYLRDLRKLYQKFNYNPALYGHFGQGCIHCRVDFDVATEYGIKKWRQFMEEATDLIVRYGGSFSGEHGDGQARAEFLYKMFGPELVQAFREFKSIWDPDWKMNPGKVVDPYRMDENLRLGATYAPWDPPTYFKYPNDGGSFAHAALRCVGIGKCRRMGGDMPEDTMCPSFMVTREESDTTRGRAHHLWEMLHGDVIADGWKSDAVKESLDLCLACKGCKGDCPVNVDMATYKAEFLSHYWEGRIRPRYAYAFGFVDQWARLASPIAGFANLFTQTPGLSALAKIASGMPRQRQIPAFAPETFKSWYKRRGPRQQSDREAILWADTFNNYFFPETAKAAVDVLEYAGYEVKVPTQHLCCGRPLYDYGFLRTARSYLIKIMEALRPEIEHGTPMVVLEPSCCSVFRDELNEMFPDDLIANKLTSQTFTLSEFLEKKVENFTPPKLERKAVVHGHCHHKAIMRFKEEKQLLKKMGLETDLLDSGCCGMAGSFGYEKDKYKVSIAAGERVLLPKVREADLSSIIIADGFSCKEQIAQETPRKALHTAEVLKLAMNDGQWGAADLYPERHIVGARIAETKKSMARAALVTGAVAMGAVMLGVTGLTYKALKSDSKASVKREKESVEKGLKALA
jgi:FAD/FMN-containing dehydrogenase/Fe-S oxidoreductase